MAVKWVLSECIYRVELEMADISCSGRVQENSLSL